MNWLVLGVAVAIAGIGVWWLFRALQGVETGNGKSPRLLVEARRRSGGWITISVTIVNETPDDLYIHTVGLTDPPLGEFMVRASEIELPLCGREIAVNRRLPPSADGMDVPITTIALMLDDPAAVIDEIGLTVALSRRSDWSDCAVLSKRTHVWISPL